MKILKRIIIIYTFILLFTFIISEPVYSNPGSLDSNGGHYVRTAGWGYSVGSYHSHDRSSTQRNNSGSNDSSGRIGFITIVIIILLFFKK